MTTPTRSMARMAHSPPSPPPSAARLGQDSDSWAPPTTSPARLPPVAASVVSGVGHVGQVAASTVLVVGVGHVGQVAASTVLVAGQMKIGRVVGASVCGLALVVVAGSVIAAVSTVVG